MRAGFLTLVATLLCASCATPSPDPASRAAPDTDWNMAKPVGFAESAAGAVHPRSGLVCPAVVENFQLQSTEQFAEDGTDIACRYERGADTTVTVYFSRYPDNTLQSDIAGTAAAMRQVYEPRGFSMDEQLSSTCGSESLDPSKILGAFMESLETDSNTVEVVVESAIVMSSPDANLVTFAITREPFEKQFLKLRMTAEGATEGEVKAHCGTAFQLLDAFGSDLRTSRGFPAPEENDLMRLIQNLPSEDDS